MSDYGAFVTNALTAGIEQSQSDLRYRSLAAARTDGWSIVTVARAMPVGGVKVTSGPTVRTDRIHHQLVADVSALRLIYPNWTKGSAPEEFVGESAAPANPSPGTSILLKVGLERTITTTDLQTTAYYRGRAGSLLTATVQPLADGAFEFPSVDLKRGEVFYSRAAYDVQALNGWSPATTRLWGGSGGGLLLNNGEGTVAADYAHGGGYTALSGYGYGLAPLLVLGRVKGGGVLPSLAITGDSINEGVGDDGYSAAIAAGAWVRWAVANNVGTVHVARSGERAAQYSNQQYNQQRNAYVLYATAVCDDLGTNDLYTGGNIPDLRDEWAGQTPTIASFDGIRISILRCAVPILARGQNYLRQTIYPRVTSTDGCRTVAGQTPVGGDGSSTELVRLAVNAWLRDTGPTGFRAEAVAYARARAGAAAIGQCYIVDTASAMEVDASGNPSLTGGRWRVGNLIATTSGTIAVSSVNASNNTFTPSVIPGWTANALQGMVVRVLSDPTTPAAVGQARTVAWNGTGSFSLYPTGFGVTPSANAVFEIYQGPSPDGIHPSGWGYGQISAWLQANVTRAMLTPDGIATT